MSRKLPLDTDSEIIKAEFEKSNHWDKTGIYVVLRSWFQWVITWPELEEDWDIVACTLDWLHSQMRDWKSNDQCDADQELEKLADDDLEWEDIAANLAGEAPADGERRKLSGKDCLSEMRRRTKNGLHLSKLCMEDPKTRNYGRMYHALGNCLHSDYRSACKELGAQRSAARFQADRANRSWLGCLQRMAKLAHDRRLCETIGISFDASRGAADGHEVELCAFFWKIILSFMIQRAWSMVFFSEVMPESSYGILSDQYDQAVGCMARCHELFLAVMAAEAIITGDATDLSRALEHILDDLSCHLLQLVREWWAQAIKENWSFKDKDLRFMTYMFAGAPSNTRVGNEHVFQVTKHEATVSNKNNRVSWPRLYRLLATAHRAMGARIPSLELADDDWTNPLVASAKALKDSNEMFHSWAKAPSASIDLEPLRGKTGRGKAQHWKAAGPQADRRAASAAAYVRVDHRAGFASATRTWMNKLFLPRCFYRRQCDQLLFVSYGGEGSNGLMWPCIEIDCEGSLFFQPDPAGDLFWSCCCDLLDFTFVVSAEFVPSAVPERVRHSMVMGFTKTSDDLPLLQGFLLHATYSDLTIDLCKKVLAHLDTSLPKGTKRNKRNWVLALVKKVFDDQPDESLADMVERLSNPVEQEVQGEETSTSSSSRRRSSSSTSSSSSSNANRSSISSTWKQLRC